MVMTLQRKLTETNMKCVPDGVHHIEAIYEFVHEAHEELIDDAVCTTGWKESLNGNTRFAMHFKPSKEKAVSTRQAWRGDTGGFK